LKWREAQSQALCKAAQCALKGTVTEEFIKKNNNNKIKITSCFVFQARIP